MTQSVSVPIWLLVLILLFAGITFASHFLFPSVRWFFRKRAERVIARINQRLPRPIEPFKLARRHDMIQRLIYDPEVTKAIVDEAREDGIPENVAFERARRYAREIVPAFSATAYFTFGTSFARWLARSLYRIRLGAFDREKLGKIDPDAAVVFVINHRSNMDYVLVTYLVARASALSYAVGEWARVWPLSAVIRSMGAYFIRRKSRGQLYRKVLARYVQMATQGGVTQAMFPEGGLSLSGAVMSPRMGLLNYIVSDWAPGKRQVIFVPVAVNYDHVLEDHILIAAQNAAERKFRAPVSDVLRAVAAHLWQRATFRFKRFGTATVAFGEPLDLHAHMAHHTGDQTEAVAYLLMQRIRAVVPVLPVPLVARFLLQGLETQEALTAAVGTALDQLRANGMALPRRPAAVLVADALEILRRRDLLPAESCTPNEGATEVLTFYATSIAHHFADGQFVTTT